MGRFRGLDTDEGWIMRKLTELERRVTEQAAARRLGLQSEVAQLSVDGIGLTGVWAEIPSSVITLTPPRGYNVALVQMVATAGVSHDAGFGGNVGIQPRAGGVAGIGQSNGRPDGGGGGAGLSVTASLGAKLVLTDGVPFTLRCWAYANGPVTAGTDNVRYSATIIYSRE